MTYLQKQCTLLIKSQTIVCRGDWQFPLLCSNQPHNSTKLERIRIQTSTRQTNSHNRGVEPEITVNQTCWWLERDLILRSPDFELGTLTTQPRPPQRLMDLKAFCHRHLFIHTLVSVFAFPHHILSVMIGKHSYLKDISRYIQLVSSTRPASSRIMFFARRIS